LRIEQLRSMLSGLLEVAMHNLFKITFVLGILCISAFASNEIRPDSCGPLTESWSYKTTATDTLPPVPSDKAMVVFINHTEISNGLYRIGADGKWFAATKTKTYAYFLLSPGEHHLCGEAHAKYRAALSLNASAGETYFIGNGQTGYMGEPKLEAMNADQARHEIQRFKLAVSNRKN
jgi:hypothetical protein